MTSRTTYMIPILHLKIVISAGFSLTTYFVVHLKDWNAFAKILHTRVPKYTAFETSHFKKCALNTYLVKIGRNLQPQKCHLLPLSSPPVKGSKYVFSTFSDTFFFPLALKVHRHSRIDITGNRGARREFEMCEIVLVLYGHDPSNLSLWKSTAPTGALDEESSKSVTEHVKPWEGAIINYNFIILI